MSENINEQENYEPQAQPPTPPPAPEPAKGGRRGCGPGCALVTGAIVGAIVGSLIASSLVPWALGIPPWKLLDRNFISQTLRASGGAPAAIRTIVSGDTSAAPVVAVAARVSPSVVYIKTTQTQSDFFGQQTVQGEGSGVIYRSDGYIVTNNHVVAGAQKVYVAIDGKAPIAGTVKGTDPESDLAIVKVDQTGLPAAELGDSSNLVVGEVAVAVGAPFGLEKTVTEGVISALHRNTVAQNEMGQPVTYANLIQTDAAINPGNSGGALSNAQGQVIGINTLIRSTSGSSAGIGFAIPSNFVKSVVKQLVSGKEVGHAYIGIVPAAVSTGGGAQGAQVSRVLPDGPAAKAGMAQGDVIVKVGDAAIKTPEDLFATVRSHQPGDKVKVSWTRKGRLQTATVTLIERPTTARTAPKAGTPR